MPGPGESTRFVLIDALRGIAALAVVLFHLTEANHIPLLTEALPAWIITVIDHGNLGVPVFFVLSGFVIAHSLRDEQVTLGVAGRFMLRRSLRLDPPYWVAIAVTLALAAVSSMVVAGKQAPSVTADQVAAHLMYVQDVLGYAKINPVFWTLCLEVQFYLIYVLILATGGSRVSVLMIIAFSISLLWPIGLAPPDPWPGSFLPVWHGFLLGVGAYWSWRAAKLRPLFVGFALVIAACSIFQGNAFSLTCAATASLLLVTASTGRITSSLRWRWLQSLGAISYSLYLFHNPITGASFRLGYMLVGDSLATEIIVAATTIAGCIIFASCVFYLIEVPSMKLARMIPLTRRPDLGQSAYCRLPPDFSSLRNRRT